MKLLLVILLMLSVSSYADKPVRPNVYKPSIDVDKPIERVINIDPYIERRYESKSYIINSDPPITIYENNTVLWDQDQIINNLTSEKSNFGKSNFYRGIR